MTDTSIHNKRIAKNTLLLYVRMILIMLVSLYTSRVILKNLGVEDFGIYNIIGGIIVLFSFMNNAMSTATQRFLSFEIGRGIEKEINKVFNTSLIIHICIAIFIFVIAECIGIWFLNTQLNIAEERMVAANWVFHFSLLTFSVQVIRVPYNAIIIAYERMSFYAYISIIEVLLRLLIVYLLFFSNTDKLILYSILYFCVSVFTFLLYSLYCSKKLTSCSFFLYKDIPVYKRMLSFSGWSMLGSLANVGSQQAANILLNIFYGVVTNAAMGIANQVSQAVYSFVANFQVAFNPQIVKSYAANEREYFIDLICRSSKFSFFLIWILSLPVLNCMEFILQVWLEEVPEFTVDFCRLSLIFLLIDAISAPLWISVQASGTIRNYQILMSIIILLNIPLSYFILKLGFSPNSVLIIRIIINVVTYIVRIYYTQSKLGLPLRKYISSVLLICVSVILLSFPIPFLMSLLLDGWNGFILTVIVSLLLTSVLTYIIGLTSNEKTFLKNFALSKIR